MYDDDKPRRISDDTIRETVEAKASARGLLIRRPEAGELFIDIDSPEQWADFERALARLRKVLPLAGVKSDEPSPSKLPGRRHVVVTVPFDMTPLQRVFLQALLCSDATREWLAFVNLEKGCTDVTFFFERPEPTPPPPLPYTPESGLDY